MVDESKSPEPTPGKESVQFSTDQDSAASRDQTSLNSQLDTALSKYIEVWLFSIQFGALTGISFSTFFFRGDLERWGLIGLPIFICILLAVIFILMAWLQLAHYFSSHLIPKFLLGDSEDYNDKCRKAAILSRSMYLIIYAISFRLLASVAGILLQIASYL